MNTIERNLDVVHGKNDLEVLYEFQDFPVFMGCTEKPAKDDLIANMRWMISKSSGMIQLNPLLPLEVVYPEFHGSGSVGALWLEHHKSLASFIRKHDPKSVLEIGGGHGVLSREYHKESSTNWTILEPNPSPIEGVKARFIKGFFDDKFTFDEPVDTIVHSHVLEHVYHPDQFMSHVSSFLKNGQKLIFSIPNMEEMLKKNYTNCINFEHTVFLTEPYVEHILSKHGFRLIEKKLFQNDHSIFYAYAKDDSTPVIELNGGLYEYNRSLYNNYVSYHKKLITELNEKVAKLPKGTPVYLFGAHVFAQYLINFGLDTNPIVCLLDNDANKHKKRLSGTNLKVESPKILKGVDSPVVILKAGIYNDEIKEDILENINSSVTFL